jgi:putative NADH-flavin reductase
MSKVIVFGASGFAGRAIVDELLGRGHEVVGIARDAAKLAAKPNFTAHSGSVHDSEFAADVVRGADAIVVSVTAVGDDGKELKDAVQSLLPLADKIGARLGVVGGCGSLSSVEGGPLVLDTPEWPAEYLYVAEAHARALAHLRGSTTADWFYLSPPFAFGAWIPGTRTGTFRLGEDTLIRDAEGNSTVSGADYAIAFVDEIETPKYHRTRFTIGY